MTREGAPLERLLTLRETADLLRVHPKTLQRYTRRRSNPLPCIRFDGALRFRPSAVDRWLGGREGRR
jgi:hypothetical protein